MAGVGSMVMFYERGRGVVRELCFISLFCQLPRLNSTDGREVNLSVVHWWSDADSKNESFWQIVCYFATCFTTIVM
jgi:hypothetical protein